MSGSSSTINLENGCLSDKYAEEILATWVGMTVSVAGALPTSTPTSTATRPPTGVPTNTPTATATPTSSPSPTPTSTPGCEDTYEEDDTPPNASWISTEAIPQTHTFHKPLDVDWVKFEGVADSTYTIVTSNLISDTDTVLALYPADILVDPYTRALASNDDYGAGWASRIVWRALESGTYYIRVREFLNRGGCLGYDISVQNGFEVYLPIVAR